MKKCNFEEAHLDCERVVHVEMDITCDAMMKSSCTDMMTFGMRCERYGVERQSTPNTNKQKNVPHDGWVG